MSLPAQYVPVNYLNDPAGNVVIPDTSVLIKVKYFVTGYVKLSDTMMYFRTASSDRIHVR